MTEAQSAAELAATEANLEEMLQTRLSVTSVSQQGATRTNPAVLNAITSGALSTGGTFSSIIDDISEIVERLRRTNCFRGVDAFLDRTPDSTSTVLFTLTERPLYQLRTGTSVETGGERGASVETSLVWRNVRGRMDTLKASASWLANAAAISGDPNLAVDVDYTSPFAVGPRSGTFARVGRADRSNDRDSGYSLRTTGGEAGVSGPLGRLSLESTWREVTAAPTAAPLVRDDAGHSWKTSVKHEVALDGRDDATMPTEGSFLCLREELAVPLLGDVAFAKGEIEGQVHVPLGVSGASAALALRGGGVAGRARVGVQDRFFLGGNSMRGFERRGLGPRDADHALGGQLYYCATAMASMPVPHGSLLWQLFNARVHAFASAGDVRDTVTVPLKGGFNPTRQSLRDFGKSLHDSMRVSAGLGLALETSVGRVEINFCQTVRAADGDRPNTGIHLAISETFS